LSKQVQANKQDEVKDKELFANLTSKLQGKMGDNKINHFNKLNEYKKVLKI